MAWTAPRTWVGGEIVTADHLNEQIRDNLNSLAQWTAYTPLWTSLGTAPSVGDGTLVGSYARAGNLVHARIQLTWGTTTSEGTGDWVFSLPFTANASKGEQIGRANAVFASNIPFYTFDVLAGPSTMTLDQVGLWVDGSAALADDTNMAIGSNWRLTMNVTYEANI